MLCTVWEVAGHVDNFTDPLTSCLSCRHRFRVDHLLDSAGWIAPVRPDGTTTITLQQYSNALTGLSVTCPLCSGQLTAPRQFNMLFTTKVSCSSGDDDSEVVYLRPETAQGVYVNFHHVLRTQRVKLPMGVGQIGTSFRNEIAHGPSVFRRKEFEQAELQWFCSPNSAPTWFETWTENCLDWLVNTVGLRKESLRLRRHEQLAHYAHATTGRSATRHFTSPALTYLHRHRVYVWVFHSRRGMGRADRRVESRGLRSSYA